MRKLLKFGGYCNLVIAILHLLGLFWAKEMFELTGISQEMNELSEIHNMLPFILTVLVAIIFAIFGIYALLAANQFVNLPYTKTVIYGISFIYFVRGFGEIFANYFHHSSTFMETMYSIIAIFIGVLYFFGGRYISKNHPCER